MKNQQTERQTKCKRKRCLPSSHGYIVQKHIIHRLYESRAKRKEIASTIHNTQNRCGVFHQTKQSRTPYSAAHVESNNTKTKCFAVLFLFQIKIQSVTKRTSSRSDANFYLFRDF